LTNGASGSSTSFFEQTKGIVQTNTTTGYLGNYTIQPDASTPVGTTIFRDNTANATGLAAGVTILSNGILELSASSVSLPYSSRVRTARTSDTNYSLANITLGQGFSSINPNGTTIATTMTFAWPPSSVATNWYGPLLFGNAYGTSTGKLTLSGTMNLNGIQQQFYVFNGTTTNGSTAEIAGVIAGAAIEGSVLKSGPGTLRLSAKNTYTGVTWVDGGTLESSYIGLQYGNGSSTVGSTIELWPGSTYRYIGSGSQTYATLDLSRGSTTFKFDGAAGAYFPTMSLGVSTTLTGSANQNVICEISSLSDTGIMNLSGSNSWKISGLNPTRTTSTTVVSGSKLIISREDNGCTLGVGIVTVSAGATLEAVTGELQSGRVTYKGNLVLGTAGSGAVKAKYKIGNGPVKDGGATNATNLSFATVTNIVLSNSAIYNGPGEYILYKYTGTCTGFENLNITTNIAGRLVSHMRHDPTYKRIYVTLS
jgi:autotransporter-associated beta strand protein